MKWQRNLTNGIKRTSNSRYKKPILVGHNITFDIGFIQQTFKDCKIDLSKYIAGEKDFFGNFFPTFIDTIHISKLALGHDDQNYSNSANTAQWIISLPIRVKIKFGDVVNVDDGIADISGTISDWETTNISHKHIVTGKQIGRASCRERVFSPV